MIALMWILTWLPPVLSAMTELPKPVNLTLTSKYFRHNLTWQPGTGTPTGVSYNVTVSTVRGTSWTLVDGCNNVRDPLVCNVTDELCDPWEVYFFQVIALRGAQLSKSDIHPEFKPIRDTHMDLPQLTVTPCHRALCVDLNPPMEHLRKIYDNLTYKLKIKSNSSDRAEFFQKSKSLSTQILVDLAPSRLYCVSVCFADSLAPRESNYSQPICAFTSGIFSADPWISAMLCLVVLFGVGVLALLVFTGFFCLKRRPLPRVLTSSHHIEGVLVITPSSTSLSSLLIVKPALPSSGEKRSNQSLSDESDGESGTETTSGNKGYKLRVGTNLTSSSSSSTSSLSACASPKLKPQPNVSSNQTSDLLIPQPEVPVSTETRSCSGLNHTLSTDTDSPTVTKINKDKEEKEVVAEADSQDVNLLTLTFGRHEEEEEESHLDVTEVEPESDSASEEDNIAPIQLSQTSDTKKVATETVSCSADEEEEEGEEEEEDSGYMGRPRDVLQSLL
ncbi:cytokine receptor family member b2 isoform X1 [Lates japonicus]